METPAVRKMKPSLGLSSGSTITRVTDVDKHTENKITIIDLKKLGKVHSFYKYVGIHIV